MQKLNELKVFMVDQIEIPESEVNLKLDEHKRILTKMDKKN